MEHISSFIKESLSQSLSDAALLGTDCNNETVINEAFQSTYLQQVVNQLRKNTKDPKNRFGYIFAPLDADWSRITDADFEEYKAGDKEGIRKARSIVSGKTWTHACVILKNNDGTFRGMICFRGYITFFNKERTAYNYDEHKYEEVYNAEHQKIIQRDVSNECKEHDFLLLDLSKFAIYDKRSERRNAKSGMVLQGDPDYYRNLASENMERYKKLAAQIKQKKNLQNETIHAEVKTILNEVMKLANSAATNPDKYIKCQYDIGRLIERTYKSSLSKDDCLLPLYSTYIEYTISIASNGGYSFQRSDIDSIKDRLRNTIDKLSIMIEQIQEKIA